MRAVAAIKGVADQRELIVRAARRAIARDGLAGLRVRAVAADVGLSHASVLHYFGSKNELVRGVIDSVIHGDIARPLVEQAPVVDPTSELRRLLTAMNSPPADDDDDHYAVMLELLRHGYNEQVHAPLMTYTTVWRDYLVDLIERGQSSGDFRADLDLHATAGLIIEFSLGLKIQTPLPDSIDNRAIEQLLQLISSSDD